MIFDLGPEKTPSISSRSMAACMRDFASVRGVGVAGRDDSLRRTRVTQMGSSYGYGKGGVDEVHRNDTRR